MTTTNMTVTTMANRRRGVVRDGSPESRPQSHSRPHVIGTVKRVIVPRRRPIRIHGCSNHAKRERKRSCRRRLPSQIVNATIQKYT